MNRMIRCSVLLISMMGSGLFGAAPVCRNKEAARKWFDATVPNGPMKHQLWQEYQELHWPSDYPTDFYLPLMGTKANRIVEDYLEALRKKEEFENAWATQVELAEENGVVVPSQTQSVADEQCIMDREDPGFRYEDAVKKLTADNLELGGRLEALRRLNRVAYTRTRLKVAADMKKEYEREQRWQFLASAGIVTAAVVVGSPEGRQLISSLLIRGLLYA